MKRFLFSVSVTLLCASASSVAFAEPAASCKEAGKSTAQARFVSLYIQNNVLIAEFKDLNLEVPGTFDMRTGSFDFELKEAARPGVDPDLLRETTFAIRYFNGVYVGVLQDGNKRDHSTVIYECVIPESGVAISTGG